MVLMQEHTPPPGASLQRVGRGLRQRGNIIINKILSKGCSRINTLKEKIIYFYSLSVNYNNRSPAVGNDSQNGINCHWRATILY
jgi:hypothetical protein